MFLMTFRGFASPEHVFDLLVERYQMDHPAGLSSEEFDEWKEKKLRPTQHRVLTVLTMWLGDHRLLDEEPHMARSLTEFLSLIVTPPLAITAKLMLQTLERLVSMLICTASINKPTYMFWLRHLHDRTLLNQKLPLGEGRNPKCTKMTF